MFAKGRERESPSSLTRFMKLLKAKISYLSRKNINGDFFFLMIWFTAREVTIFVVWFSENSSNFTCLNYVLLSFLVNNYWQLLRPEEVEILVCGSPELDMHALQRSTQYDGYAKTDSTIRWALHTSDSEVTEEGMKDKVVSFICVTDNLRIQSAELLWSSTLPYLISKERVI